MAGMSATSTVAREYHHGDLPNALRSAAAKLISTDGLAGFSLRKVARAAGVSHAAPAHHFGDTRGLLTSLATEGFVGLAQAFQQVAATESNPIERLVVQGQRYVEYAFANRGHHLVMTSADWHDAEDQALIDAGLTAFNELLATLEAIRVRYNPELDVEVAARLCWASVEGTVVLNASMAKVADHRGGEIVELSEQAAQNCRLLIAGLVPVPGTPDT